MAHEINVFCSEIRRMEKRKMKSTLLDFLIVVSFGWVLMMFGACSSIDYEQEDGKERLQVKTLWKSLDGLRSDRDKESFNLIIDKTYTHDPLRAIADLLKTYEQLHDMGVRYDLNRLSPLRPDLKFAVRSYRYNINGVTVTANLNDRNQLEVYNGRRLISTTHEFCKITDD